MEFVSVFNDVLGPVMRGPSSSHTAGAYRIGKMARDLLGEEPASARFTFDPAGSYAPTYIPLGVDLAFTAGIMGWSMLDEHFTRALERAKKKGVDVGFAVESFTQPVHPNTVRIEMTSRRGDRLLALAESIGGGVVQFTRLEDWPVHLTGKSHEIVVESVKTAAPEVTKLLSHDGQVMGEPRREERDEALILTVRRAVRLDSEWQARLEELPGVRKVWTTSPVFFVTRGEPLFSSAKEMVSVAEERNCSLGEVALAYESALLGLTEDEVMEETFRRFEIMRQSVHGGLDDEHVDMLLLKPVAHRVYESEAEGRLAVGGMHTRAAARAMAVMHVCNSRGVVCAAPTGGSAGVVPGVVVTLAEEKGMDRERCARALFAASAIGLVVAIRATFAAEVAGCQVEIGAAGAMAAAAVVEEAGGRARQAADAAAIALQNTMGSVCDPVQGTCEIPCHTRNAVAASSAFVCADLVLGGYQNPIPLDETVDASYQVGKSLPRELRCTAAGGLAVTPSALSLPRLR
ncbi:MAG: L-serine ammonia-lyase, iron-sulfur-dependent, subunit alpha [Acidobacteriota bacterium]